MTPDQLGQFLDKLGQYLGPAGSHVFDLAVRQQFIEGLYGLGMLIVLGVIALALTLVLRGAFVIENAKPNVEDHLPWNWRLVIYLFAWSLFLFVLLLAGSRVVSQLLNPEWAAITSLINTVTGH